MPRYGMAIDLRTCMGCAACVVACKVENRVDEDAFRCRVTQRSRGEFPNVQLEILSERCNQCSDAPCVWNCPTGASHYAEGGVVLVNGDRCTGCKACLAACPYDARFINSRGVAEKCTFCLHRVKEGQHVGVEQLAQVVGGGLVHVLGRKGPHRVNQRVHLHFSQRVHACGVTQVEVKDLGRGKAVCSAGQRVAAPDQHELRARVLQFLGDSGGECAARPRKHDRRGAEVRHAHRLLGPGLKPPLR